VDREHVFPLIKAVHGADFDAVHILALDALFYNYVGHGRVEAKKRVRIAAN
jgi:hypothetical protein